MIKMISSVVVAVFLLAGNIYAQNAADLKTKPKEVKSHIKAPPAILIDACKGKIEGAVCERATLHNGIKSGICTYTPGKEYLYCKIKSKTKPVLKQKQAQGESGSGPHS